MVSRVQQRKRYDQSPWGKAMHLYHAARKRAVKKGVPFTITVEDIFFPLELGLCQLSGLPLNMRGSRSNRTYSPSVHRIDPSKGYVSGNIQIVCWSLNAMIGEWGAATFEEIAYQHLLRTRPDLVIQKARRSHAVNDNQLDMFAMAA